MAPSSRFCKRALYGVCSAYVLCTALLVLLEPLLALPPCDARPTAAGPVPNAFYVDDPCRTSVRYLRLAGLTPQECAFGRHLAVAVLLGSVVGYERRMADRPAGIKTTSLVALAAALFTINGTFAFAPGPMTWDAARVSAAVPSGVGFLGGGLMVKDVLKETQAAAQGGTPYTIAGLTTAVSVWISAACGIACGGGLYFEATFTAALLLTLLRFGPRPPTGDGDVFRSQLTVWSPGDAEHKGGDTLHKGAAPRRRVASPPMSLLASYQVGPNTPRAPELPSLTV